MSKHAYVNLKTLLLTTFIACNMWHALTPPALAQDSKPAEKEAQTIDLPSPTGRFPVGVTTWHWIDTDRADTYSPIPGTKRELMVHAWYPASVTDNAKAAPYRPLARNNHDVIHKYSIAGAPFAKLSTPAPVILICPGRGTSAEYNTSLAEDLASHGYAIFAVDSPYIGRVDYPDGRHVSPLPIFRPSRELMMGPYEKVDAFFEGAVALGAQDYYYALGQIMNLNKADPAGRFTGKLDVANVGIYGHSLGGRICGEVAATRPVVKAFAAMEAVPPRNRRRAGLDAAVMMMHSSDFPEDLALPNMEEIIPMRKSDVFFARFEGMGHNSSTDLPLITGQDPYQIAPKEGLRIMRLALLGFFDAYLKNSKFPNKAIQNEPRIQIRSFPKH